MQDNGSQMICINTGVEKGKKVAPCTIDTDFLINYKDLNYVFPDGVRRTFRSRAHECHIHGIVTE